MSELSASEVSEAVYDYLRNETIGRSAEEITVALFGYAWKGGIPKLELGQVRRSLSNLESRAKIRRVRAGNRALWYDNVLRRHPEQLAIDLDRW